MMGYYEWREMKDLRARMYRSQREYDDACKKASAEEQPKPEPSRKIERCEACKITPSLSCSCFQAMHYPTNSITKSQ